VAIDFGRRVVVSPLVKKKSDCGGRRGIGGQKAVSWCHIGSWLKKQGNEVKYKMIYIMLDNKYLRPKIPL